MEKRVYSLIGTAKLRLRLQRVMEGVTTGLIASALVWMVLLVLYKTHWLDVSTLTTWALGALVFPAAGLLWAFLHRIDARNIALTLDETNRLKGRLTSVYCFLELPEGERTPFMEAAIRESAGHMDNVQVAAASPFGVPRDLLVLALVALVLALVFLFKPVTIQGTLPPIVDPVVTVVPAFDEDSIDVEKQKWEEVREQLAASDDPEAQEFIGEMDRLFEDLDQKKLDKEKFLTEVDKIENKFFEDKKDEMEPLLEELKKISDEFENSKLTEELGKALDAKDLGKVAEELEKLAKKVENGEISDKELEKVASKLEKLAKKFENESERLDKLVKDKEKEIEALKKKYEANKGKLSDSQKKRLSRLGRDLKKLKKRAGASSKSGRKRSLKRLSKASKEGAKMARSVKKRGKGAGKTKEAKAGAKDEFKKNMGQASKELKGLDKKNDTRKSMNKAKSQIGDMKEQIGRGQGKPQDAKQKKMANNFKNAAEGKKPGEAEKGPQGGQQGKAPPGAQGTPSDKASSKGGSGDNQQDGKGAGDPNKTAKADSDKTGKSEAKGEGSAKGAGGAGTGKGDKGDGKESGLAEKGFKDTKIEGKEGDGPVKEEIILSAASEGFASQEYQDVYVEFKDVVEEVLESEEVPPGYQYYVRRYFDMIRPRGAE